MQLPYRKKEDDRLALMKQDFHVTPKKLEDMKRTLEQLKKDRPRLVAELTTAREMGDLSENAAYTIAKANLRRSDGKVLSLEDRIKNAIVIEKSDDGKVAIGSRVTLVLAVPLPSGASIATYDIVGPAETDPSKGRISFQSPLGMALIGKVAGDTVEVNGRALGTIQEVA